VAPRSSGVLGTTGGAKRTAPAGAIVQICPAPLVGEARRGWVGGSVVGAIEASPCEGDRRLRRLPTSSSTSLEAGLWFSRGGHGAAAGSSVRSPGSSIDETHIDEFR
jgi:hypothetical protein